MGKGEESGGDILDERGARRALFVPSDDIRARQLGNRQLAWATASSLGGSAASNRIKLVAGNRACQKEAVLDAGEEVAWDG